MKCAICLNREVEVMLNGTGYCIVCYSQIVDGEENEQSLRKKVKKGIAL